MEINQEIRDREREFEWTTKDIGISQRAVNTASIVSSLSQSIIDTLCTLFTRF